ncbi:MAG: hypothetical protein KDB53_13480, partial [Planctomycetes bacterium]|nr:hypothetical protein [Planctomycetota bacterium]
LVLLGDLVPPEVYLSLGDAFLEENDVRLASRTYAMATDVPDHAAFQRKVAASFEAAGFRKEALGIYEQVLIGQSGDVGLIRKVALLDEELGRDAISADLLERALELMLSRRAFSSVKREEKPTDDSPFSRMWGGNNLDDYDRYFDEVLASYLVVADAGAGVAAHLDRLDRSVEEERVRVLASRPDEAAKFTLRNYPRLLAKSALFRRLALKTGRVREAESADLVLLATFRDDASLLGDLVEQRLAEGFVASARRLIEESLRTESEKEEARFLAGSGGEATPGLVSAAAATRLFLPMVLADHLDEARSVLHRVDLPAMSEDDLRTMPQLVSVSVFLEDSDSALNFARRWIAAAGKFKESWEMQEQAQKAIDAVWPILDNDQRRSVVDGVIQKLVEDPQKASSLVYTVAELQKKFEEPLIEAEQVKEMLEKGGLTGNFYNVAGLLSLMPATEHLAVIKELWAKVPSVRRVTFLLDILAGVDAVLAEDIAAFIEDKFPAALDEQTRPVFQYYIERSIANNEKNPELALRLSEALWKKDPKEPDYFLGHASALRTAGRLQEAWDVAKASIVHLVDRESIDWKFTQAAAALANLFGGGDLGQIYQALDALEAERGKSMNSVMLRVELGGQDRDLSRRITDLKAALDRFPEEAKIRNQLRSAYRLAGYVVESLELLEKDARERPNPSVTRQVVMGWKALDQPVRARRLADELSGRAESNASKTVAAPPGKTQPASVADLKSSIEKGEVDEARRQWREVWRQFSRMRDDSRLRFFSWGPIRHGWPRDEDDENRPRSKGGLPDLDKNTPPTTPSSAYMVLAEQPFGEDEFRRQIRSLMPAELDRASDVLEGLSRAVVYRAGPEGALRELLEPVIRGLAGKSDYVSLLDLLESRPELLGSEADRILEELASTLNPSDGKQIRRLARLNARTGRTADALRLYRWCLPLLTSSRFDFWSQGVSTDEIIEELMKILDGEDRETAIEIVLAGSTPGAFENDSDRYEALVLSARARLHGAAAALEACPEIVSRVIDPANQERDQAARKALPLFVSVGRHDAARICLEKVICRRESNTLRRFRGSSGVRFQPRELAEVFPRPKDGEGVEWYQLAAHSVAKWSADRRLGLDAAGQILAVLALRLHQAGAVDEAQTLAREAAGTLVDQPATLLWVIDVMTLIGLDDEAHVFTAGLLAERRLDWRRVAGHVRQVLDREGPSSALVIGEEAAEWTLSEELLAVLTDAASVLGDTEAQTRVAALVAARKAAVAADEASN